MSFHRPGRLWIPEAPNLILGRGPCPRPTIEAYVAGPMVRYAGIFKWELINSRTKQVVRSGEMKNLVLDSGLNAIGNSIQPVDCAAWCAVGTDATAPAAAQGGCLAPVGARISRTDTGNDANGNGPGSPPTYWYWRKVFLFLEAEGNGNLTEVSVHNASTGGFGWARQLFKDTGGSPTVITKTSAEQLKITYEMRVYPPTVDTGANVTISTVVYAWACRAQRNDPSTPAGWGNLGMLNRMSSWSSFFANASNATALGPINGSLTGATQNANSDTTTVGAFTSGVFSRDLTHKWEPGTANFTGGSGGISGFQVWNGAGVSSFQMLFTPAFAKDSTKRLTLVLRYSWGRYP